jgi:cyclic beta-1,2-glucan synthetase
VRENGAQYTHAAIWTVIAFAELGDGDKAAELLAMLNPITHAATPHGVQKYRVEPYVVVGDIYSEAPHIGRGGWTWYTGSAGWLYRAGIEWLLGVRVQGARLVVNPCIPSGWPGFTVTLRYRSAQYDIAVENPSGVCQGVAVLELDGVALDDCTGVPFADDGRSHRVRAVLGDGAVTRAAVR